MVKGFTLFIMFFNVNTNTLTLKWMDNLFSFSTATALIFFFNEMKENCLVLKEIHVMLCSCISNKNKPLVWDLRDHPPFTFPHVTSKSTNCQESQWYPNTMKNGGAIYAVYKLKICEYSPFFYPSQVTPKSPNRDMIKLKKKLC